MATATTEKTYFLVRGSKKVGPYTLDQLRALKAAGKLPAGKGIRVVENKQAESVYAGGSGWDAEAADTPPNPPAATPPAPPAPAAQPMQPQAAAAPVNVVGHVTTEKTRKDLKIHSVIAWLLFLGGIGVMLLSTTVGEGSAAGAAIAVTGSLSVVVSIPYGIVNRIRIWWHHG